MTTPWRFHTRFSVIALSRSASGSDVKPAALGEMDTQLAAAVVFIAIDCAMKTAPVLSRTWRRFGFCALIIPVSRRPKIGPWMRLAALKQIGDGVPVTSHRG